MLAAHVKTDFNECHLRKLLADEKRSEALTAEFVPGDGSDASILLDYARQNMTLKTRELMMRLARCPEVNLKEKISALFAGSKINVTEGRAVMHPALRAPLDGSVSFEVDGKNVVPDVVNVRNRAYNFADSVRRGEWVGATGKRLVNVISVGIGGSYLGPEFVYEALRCDPKAAAAAQNRSLRFLANVDPVDVKRATEKFNPEETLVVVVSKTFTTAETMLNARSLRSWLLKHIEGDDAKIISKHMIAVSANVDKATAFGIEASNVFGFWNWVGGRYSVCSAVGVVPLALQYGREVVEAFLAGAHEMDLHFANASFEENLPVLMGLLGVWNSTFLGREARAILPYSQALLRFPAHVQQVDMESNGKGVSVDGAVLPFQTGEINFGEPGTNGQHSFYQLIHQGRVIPCEFIASIESQAHIQLEGEPVSNHDELMCNFFAQPDALANGRTRDELVAQGVPKELLGHKEFPGNRPSLSLLFRRFDARGVGQLLALYEHRTAVQGFVWGIPSFDQWGVELGKVLAKVARSSIEGARKRKEPIGGFNSSTTRMMKRYLA